jgi:hypothetical protein
MRDLPRDRERFPNKTVSHRKGPGRTYASEAINGADNKEGVRDGLNNIYSKGMYAQPNERTTWRHPLNSTGREWGQKIMSING